MVACYAFSCQSQSLPKKKSSDKDVFNEAGEDVPEDEDVVSEAVRKYQKERSQYAFLSTRLRALSDSFSSGTTLL